MPATLFKPRIDGIEFGDDWTPSQPDIAVIRESLLSVCQATESRLRDSYKGAVDVYGLGNWMRAWTDFSIADGYWLKSGMNFIVLDFFYTRKIAPRISNKPESRARIRSRLRERTVDALKANAETLLTSLTVSCLLPDPWIPESAIVNPVREEINKLGVFSDPVIDINLEIPASGESWVQENNIEQWELLKKHIDAGRPWPITLLDAKTAPYEGDTVIAYSYGSSETDGVSILFHDVDTPDQEHQLEIRFGDQSIVSSLHGKLLGFLCESYEPPPGDTSVLARLIRYVMLRPVIWRVVRYLRRIRSRDL